MKNEHEEYLDKLRRDWYFETQYTPWKEWQDSMKDMDLTPRFCEKCGHKLHKCTP